MENLPSSHRTQIDAGITASLLKAGLPAPLVRKQLSSLPNGVSLTAFANALTASDGDLRLGRFVRLHTDKPTSSDAFFLLLRAFHLKGAGCRHASLARIIRYVETEEYDTLDALLDPVVLCITSFQDSSESPMPAGVRFQAQELVLERLRAGKSVFVQTCGPSNLAAGWWTPSFVEAIGELEIRVPV